jgi:hypothetical protein
MKLAKLDSRGSIILHYVQYTYGGGMESEEDAYPRVAQFFCGANEELSGSGKLSEGTYYRKDANCQDCIRKSFALEREELTEGTGGVKT